jgi:hypothetical protein
MYIVTSAWNASGEDDFGTCFESRFGGQRRQVLRSTMGSFSQRGLRGCSIHFISPDGEASPPEENPTERE